MSQQQKNKVDADAAAFASERSGLLRACVIAVVGGLLIGVVGAGVRAGLSWMQVHHVQAIQWAKAWPWLGWLLPVIIGAVGAGLARLLVRPVPLAGGSGVQDVEAIMRGEAEPPSLWVLPVKFFGGLLSIGTGLALGREGPTVQMGAAIGGFLARLFRCAKASMRDLQAALGGAGLAVAFNAPLGGAMFVFEEVAHAFRLRLTAVTLIATAMAILVSRLILGGAPDFNVSIDNAGAHWQLLLYAVFGFALGLLGVLYNKLTVWGLEVFSAAGKWPPEVRAAIIGAVVGVVAWFAPDLVGGGDDISQKILNGGLPLAALLVIFVVRWLLGPLSYSAGTPGGLFAPLLLVGAASGALFATLSNQILPDACALSAVAFAVVGMTAFFTGVVRAPLTGIILISEMTATTTLMLPMVAACLCALLSASWVRGEPIYDTLRRRMLEGMKPAAATSAR